jgi:hypothetical protein
MFGHAYLPSGTFPVTLVLISIVCLIDVIVSILFRLMSILILIFFFPFP